MSVRRLGSSNDRLVLTLSRRREFGPRHACQPPVSLQCACGHVYRRLIIIQIGCEEARRREGSGNDRNCTPGYTSVEANVVNIHHQVTAVAGK